MFIVSCTSIPAILQKKPIRNLCFAQFNWISHRNGQKINNWLQFQIERKTKKKITSRIFWNVTALDQLRRGRASKRTNESVQSYLKYWTFRFNLELPSCSIHWAPDMQAWLVSTLLQIITTFKNVTILRLYWKCIICK